ncbi:phosphatidylserine decarboxylase proenzyme, mitochondrial isoform X4 [Tribolium madens]|uniref:phosphatidylserine decarboxylase proenzyme, mitochondrial isoform X4 n=1 Tax=Tribolium madens TaxID=41895 RepID=UPI001CF73A86|nr:phosphatidylserine decarboxylase proenzyme, mitochondrial isoform X4 [Tribolium madens]
MTSIFNYCRNLSHCCDAMAFLPKKILRTLGQKMGNRLLLYVAFENGFSVVGLVCRQKNTGVFTTCSLWSYPSLADFFARPLKNGIRTIDHESDLVSPCDGTVLHFGTVHTGEIEQVKGVTYSLENFLGENTWNNNNNNVKDYRTSLLHNAHTLYQCVIYLAPGDYHRFHSPANWKPTHRRHFHGELLSVSPRIAKWVPGLFCLNERAVYLGSWDHGFFSYAAVGATNVGTVKVYCDKTLHTNHPKKSDRCKDLCLGNDTYFKKGDPFGEFRMGSTIVLVFEAPVNFQFTILPGDRVQMGQGLGRVGQHKFVDRLQPTPQFINKAI